MSVWIAWAAGVFAVSFAGAGGLMVYMSLQLRGTLEGIGMLILAALMLVAAWTLLQYIPDFITR